MEKIPKILSTAGRWLFILCLPVLLLTAGIGWAVNSLWLYESGFSKYNISQTTGLAEPELEKAATELIDYFNSGEEYINLTVIKDGKAFVLFSQREVAHLRDVKGLIRLDYWLMLGTGIYVLVHAGLSLFRQKARRRLAKRVVVGSSATLALILAFGLAALLDFDRLFLQFHFISFANDLWQLDPTKDYLIMLFPRGFWYDAALVYALITAGLAVVLGGVSGGYLAYTTKNTLSSHTPR